MVVATKKRDVQNPKAYGGQLQSRDYVFNAHGCVWKPAILIAVIQRGDEEEEWHDQSPGGENQPDHCHHEAAGAEVSYTT